MRWIRRLVMGFVVSWAWRNRDRIKQRVSELADGAPAPGGRQVAPNRI